MILDTNILIYATQAQFTYQVRPYVTDFISQVSVITRIEALGYHQLTVVEKRKLENFFAALTTIPLSTEVVETAIHLRQQRKMGLGDAIVASTALTTNLPLVTRNIKDFDWITDLQIINPFIGDAS